MQNQKRILTLLLITGASLLPPALHAREEKCTVGVPCCYSLPSDGSMYPPSPYPIDFPKDFPQQSELVGPASIHLTPISTCRVGLFNTKGSEIVAYDPQTRRLFVVNQAQAVETPPPTLDVIDIRDPASPRYEGSIDLSISYEGDSTVSRVLPTSVAVKNGIVAVAVHPDPDPTIKEGRVLLYKANLNPKKKKLQWLRNIEVGFAPDMLTFTPNGKMILVANTGLPPATAGDDPTALGSVSFIDIDIPPYPIKQATKVSTVDFTAFNGKEEDLRTKGVRIFNGFVAGRKLDWSVAQSLQPEYITIAVANNSLMAWVSLEVNNAVAVLDIEKGQITDILPLGVKDHRLKDSGFVSWDGMHNSTNGFDASDQDGAINIANWPVFGMYQPDAMEAYQTLDGTYLVTANEGSYFKFGKDNKGNDVDERARVRDIANISPPLLDSTVFPDPKNRTKVGNLKVSNWQGYDSDMDGDYDALYAFSSRSFSIWSEKGERIFDSGDDFEQIQKLAHPSYFNCDDNSNVFDDKSDDQGVQPDGLTIGKLDERYYAFVVLQRVGGIMVYDITNPKQPRFQQYINNRNFEINPNQKEPEPVICKTGESDEGDCAKAGDLGPEGVLFISEADSPTKEPLLVVANQTSSTTTVYRIERLPPPR